MPAINEITQLRRTLPHVSDRIERWSATCARRLSRTRKGLASAAEVHEATVSRWYSGMDSYSPIANGVAFKRRIARSDSARAWEIMALERAVVIEAEVERMTTRALLLREQELGQQLRAAYNAFLEAQISGAVQGNRELAAEEARHRSALDDEYGVIQTELGKPHRIAEVAEIIG